MTDDSRIRVVGVDLMCFPVDATTLEPLSCGSYDPWAWIDPVPGYRETIHINEWQTRRNSVHDKLVARERAAGGER